MTQARLTQLCDRLIREAYDRLARPRTFMKFTGVKEADVILNDIEGHPHAFVIACIMDRQIRAEKAWSIPYKLKQRLGFFDFSRLASLSPDELEQAMLQPEPLHHYPTLMSKYLYAAIRRIQHEFHGNAAAIWAGRPSSATIVRRFLEFDGVGQKIATMAANSLVRDFRIEVSDRYSIDISVDVQVRRVFSRMGFVPENANVDYIIYRARELHPEYPGIFDLVLWELGRTVCRPKQPACEQCSWAQLCAYANGGV
ncbi:MAG: iron-sulfur cluster loop [Bacillota bacterium]